MHSYPLVDSFVNKEIIKARERNDEGQWQKVIEEVMGKIALLCDSVYINHKPRRIYSNRHLQSWLRTVSVSTTCLLLTPTLTLTLFPVSATWNQSTTMFMWGERKQAGVWDDQIKCMTNDSIKGRRTYIPKIYTAAKTLHFHTQRLCSNLPFHPPFLHVHLCFSRFQVCQYCCAMLQLRRREKIKGSEMKN